ncbi:DUF4118 domain-containing protein [Phenylobacterium sp. J367]|uniref:DUF4118 domain-containing protein n=1 Tax=Phenylobacterium sp. J367 TaxID=2898435 RepID=UPI002151DCE8|nr:DUF4118 domain-containing protein [Phenylobacterium sp. J367]MCR5881027.1 DUF4118 domain-containing protein [Phenylobacterium sp. J367]
MIRRLTEFDLPGRLGVPKLVAEAGLALVLVAAAMALRSALEVVSPGILPFALSFPAVLAATMLAGRRAGLMALVLGGLGPWYFFVEPRFSFAAEHPSAMVNVLIYALSAGLIVLVGDAYRGSALRFAGESATQLREREALLAALRESQARLDLATSAGEVGGVGLADRHRRNDLFARGPRHFRLHARQADNARDGARPDPSRRRRLDPGAVGTRPRPGGTR